MYKYNSRNSNELRGCSSLQSFYKLTGLKLEIGNNSYTKRWQ